MADEKQSKAAKPAKPAAKAGKPAQPKPAKVKAKATAAAAGPRTEGRPHAPTERPRLAKFYDEKCARR